MERDFTSFKQHVINRIKNELMFSLDDFSEIIASRFKKHLRRLRVSPQRMKKLTHVAMNISPIQGVTRFELHVRQIQFT